MYSLPKPGFDPETMRAVAAAYRRESQAGRLDGPARDAVMARRYNTDSYAAVQVVATHNNSGSVPTTS